MRSMTKPYNIFLLSRITNETSFNRVKTHSCGESEAKKTPYHEIISFKQLADGFLQNGVDVRTLQEVLGHEHLNTTQIYTHVDNAELRIAADANPLGKFKPNKK